MKRLLLAVTATVALLVALAAPASAHVTIDPGTAAPGGFAALTVRVPNERDDASTSELSITMPDELESFRVMPAPGWEYAVDGATITWSGGEIGPGEFMEFGISVGPLPDEDGVLRFPAVQTYDDGDVVRWIEEGDGAEKPAPSLTLAATEGVEHAEAGSSDDDGTDPLTFAALLVGGVAFTLALAALVRAGRRIPQ